ncbi:MAG: tetratricopeptide repeat protein [Candidatus Aminicenantes bacterium]|jgi:tetratricopeptide (TPR) repeat protein
MVNKRILTSCIIIFFCIVFQGNFLLSQSLGYGRLEGRVTDEDGNPIPNATVTVEKLQHVSKHLTTFKKTATTNAKGLWRMFHVSGGDVVVTAAADGYFPETERVEISQDYPNLHVNFKLKRAELSKELPDAQKPSVMMSNHLEDAGKYIQEGRYEDAVASYELVLEDSPENYLVHNYIGNCYMKMEKFDRAEKAFLNFLEAARKENSPISIPMQADALSSLGTISARNSDNEAALEYFLQAHKLNPMDEEVNYNLGEIHFSLRKIEEAIEYFRIASDIKPTWPEPYMRLGYAYLNKNDTVKAKEYFEKFLEIAPDHPQAEGIKFVLEDIKE